MQYDRLIIGAGIFGLYAAIKSADKGLKVLLIDIDEEPLNRGSFINQARLHNGYHYPRSMSTAKKSSMYFNRFYEDFKDCVNSEFKQIYATSKQYSWTSGDQFEKFCYDAGIPCDKIDIASFFDENFVDGVFLTEEYSFDAKLIKNKMIKLINEKNVQILLKTTIEKQEKINEKFNITLSNGNQIQCKSIINATYAGVNQIHKIFGFEDINLKYELCEVILCNVTESLNGFGLTVMDGPFFSLMPFGRTGLYSITTVSKTPHVTSYDAMPTFDCQKRNKECKSDLVLNCNSCFARPKTAFPYMRQMLKIYSNSKIDVTYVKSLFTIKPILKTSEIDDSRPTLIRKYSSKPDFHTVFSGKLNTIYDLDEII